jgi:alpha-glucosidase (family GH31 glycosyl hydrolase)
MKIFTSSFGSKKVEISAYSENIVRVRIGALAPSLFDRYGIYSRPDKDCGMDIENGIRVGKLSVVYDEDEGKIIFVSSKCRREIYIGKNVDDVRAYMDEKLGGLRPEYRQIIGDEAKRNYGTIDFVKDPKYFEITTDGEKFYGLGESNDDRLILNGKTYLQRVVYQRCEIPIPFIMTKAGYGILCNSTFWHGVDVCERDANKVVWYLPDGDIDFFIFAGTTLGDILERFTRVTGRPMLMPKWAHGLTFTEQYYADQFEVMHTAEKFRALGLPCDMISLEPGWMAKRYDFSVDKKWNTERFFINDWARKDNPHEAHSGFFLSALKRYGFKVQLWLCCQHDFTAHEENLAGNDTDFGIPAWFDHLKAFQNDGARSFKVDPCHVCDSADEGRVYANGRGEPEMHNLMQTLCVKEMYQGAREHLGIRPMHHFCGGYTSTGAYSAATTGDNGGRQKSMAWMLNLGISAFSNVSCDMNVHDKFTIHYGFFMAWCQLNAWSGFEHPWWAGDEMQALFTYYDKLRYRLMPYIYSTAINCNLTGMPICRAMPLMFDDEECENTVTQYMFGDSMLVGAFSDTVYLPRGYKWIDYWTGKSYEGGQTVSLDLPSDRGGALFIKSGAIIPTEEPKNFVDCKDAKNITLEVYPDGLSSATLFEDDGITLDYENGRRTATHAVCSCSDKTYIIMIGDREGGFDGMTDERTYSVRLYAPHSPKSVFVGGKRAQFTRDGNYIVFDMGKETEANVNI